MPNAWSREFGALINTQRSKKHLPLRKVAAALDIDTSTLSKIEKGERPINSKMIPIIAELFGLDFKKLQIHYLSKKLRDEYGKEPFFQEALNLLSDNNSKKYQDNSMETKNFSEAITKAFTTIHTSRTLMFSELSKVMDHAIEDDKYLNSLNENIANKLTKTNQVKTAKYLKQLYDFDLSSSPFLALKYFWQIAGEDSKSLLAFEYALNKEYLLFESIPVVINVPIGDKVSIQKFEENIENYHPGRFTENTRLSIAQNIASSWKQAGFIMGKVKNIRAQPSVSYHVVAFAFLIAYLNGDRGDFILTSKWSKALCLSDSQLRRLASEAAKRDLMQYQYAGSVTSISFNNLFNKLGIDGI